MELKEQFKNAYSISKNVEIANNHAIGFSEWCGHNFIRMNAVWCPVYADQRNTDNWFTSEQLLERYNLILTNKHYAE